MFKSWICSFCISWLFLIKEAGKKLISHICPNILLTVVIIFKNNNPYNNFLLLFYGLILKFPSFIHPYVPASESMDGFFYRLLLRWLESLNFPSIYPLISFILVYIQALILNRFVSDQRLNHKSTYLVGMAFLLITSLIPEWEQLSSTLIANTFLIWILIKLCNLFFFFYLRYCLFMSIQNIFFIVIIFFFFFI